MPQIQAVPKPEVQAEGDKKIEQAVIQHTPRGTPHPLSFSGQERKQKFGDTPKLNDYLNQLIAESQKQPVVMVFTAKWCEHCGPLKDKINAHHQKHGDYTLKIVDTDKSPLTTKAFGIKPLPYVEILAKGKRVGMITGNLPKEVIAGEIAKGQKMFLPKK